MFLPLSCRTSWRLAAAMGAALAAVVATTVPASAHASLVRVVPEDGGVVTTAPTTVRLDFDETVTSPATVVVSGPSGRVDDGAVRVDGRRLTVKVDLHETSAYVGRYRVAFRVVATDGHPTDGVSTFQYRPPGLAAAAQRAEDDDSTQSVATPLVLAGLVTAVLLAGVLLLLPRRRR